MPHEPSRILVPVDFSAPSHGAVEYAWVLARHFDAVVHLLHVRRPPTPIPAVTPESLVLQDFIETDDGSVMKQYLRDLERSGITVRGRLEEGDPVDVIVEAADEGNYDMIVMGTHGRTGLSHWLHGSVAEKVVRRAPCPVVTIRIPDEPVADEHIIPFAAEPAAP